MRRAPSTATATDGIYKGRMEAVLGRQVEAHLSSINVDPDVAVDVFVLGEAIPGAEAIDLSADGSGADGAGPA